MIEKPLPMEAHWRAFLRARRHPRFAPILRAAAEEAMRQVQERVRWKAMLMAREQRKQRAR